MTGSADVLSGQVTARALAALDRLLPTGWTRPGVWVEDRTDGFWPGHDETTSRVRSVNGHPVLAARGDGLVVVLPGAPAPLGFERHDGISFAVPREREDDGALATWLASHVGEVLKKYPESKGIHRLDPTEVHRAWTAAGYEEATRGGLLDMLKQRQKRIDEELAARPQPERLEEGASVRGPTRTGIERCDGVTVAERIEAATNGAAGRHLDRIQRSLAWLAAEHDVGIERLDELLDVLGERAVTVRVFDDATTGRRLALYETAVGGNWGGVLFDDASGAVVGGCFDGELWFVEAERALAQSLAARV